MTQAQQPVALSWVHAQDPVTVSWLRVHDPVQTMLTAEGYRVWLDEGPPQVVVGAQVGDLYLDTTTGLLYRLD